MINIQRTYDFPEGKYTIAGFEKDFYLSRKYSRSKSCSPATLVFYREKLANFFRWCESNSIIYIEQLSKQRTRQYLDDLSKTHTQGGVHSFFRVVRAYINWIWDEYELEIRNPVSKIYCSVGECEPIAGIDINVIEKLFKAANDGFMRERDKAIIAVLIDTGIRRRNLHEIKVSDVDIVRGSIFIKRTKNGTPKTVFLGRKARRYLRAWLRVRNPSGDYDDLWIANNGRPLSIDGLRLVLERLQRKAGCTEIKNFHAFRRTFALEAWRNGVDLYGVRELLGHKTIEETKKYIKATDEDRQRVHLIASPLDNANK
jgi:site-specific recombinase XerD